MNPVFRPLAYVRIQYQKIVHVAWAMPINILFKVANMHFIIHSFYFFSRFF